MFVYIVEKSRYGEDIEGTKVLASLADANHYIKTSWPTFKRRDGNKDFSRFFYSTEREDGEVVELSRHAVTTPAMYAAELKRAGKVAWAKQPSFVGKWTKVIQELPIGGRRAKATKRGREKR